MTKVALRVLVGCPDTCGSFHLCWTVTGHYFTSLQKLRMSFCAHELLSDHELHTANRRRIEVQGGLRRQGGARGEGGTHRDILSGINRAFSPGKDEFSVTPTKIQVPACDRNRKDSSVLGLVTPLLCCAWALRSRIGRVSEQLWYLRHRTDIESRHGQ